jgi:hypothetical protein
MTETKNHSVYGEVLVLQSSSALVQIETPDGDSFWVAAASFTKKKAKPRTKKKKVVHKLDGPVIDALLVRETRAEESEPEVFDEVENVVRDDAEEETEESCEEPITSGEGMAA